MYISGFVNGVEYEDYDIDLLVEDGIININYNLVDMKKLSAEEYLNHKYSEDATISIIKLPDVEFNEEDGNVYGFVPKKIYLPLSNELFNEKKL